MAFLGALSLLLRKRIKKKKENTGEFAIKKEIANLDGRLNARASRHPFPICETVIGGEWV